MHLQLAPALPAAAAATHWLLLLLTPSSGGVLLLLLLLLQMLSWSRSGRQQCRWGPITPIHVSGYVLGCAGC
jgi:hypothetical protein